MSRRRGRSRRPGPRARRARGRRPARPGRRRRPSRRTRRGLQVGHGLRDPSRRGAVEHEAHRAVLVVVRDEHHRAVEVRVDEARARDQQLSAQRVHRAERYRRLLVTVSSPHRRPARGASRRHFRNDAVRHRDPPRERDESRARQPAAHGAPLGAAVAGGRAACPRAGRHRARAARRARDARRRRGRARGAGPARRARRSRCSTSRARCWPRTTSSSPHARWSARGCRIPAPRSSCRGPRLRQSSFRAC